MSQSDRSKVRINRREFIRGAAAAGAALTLPGCVGNIFSDNGLTAEVAILRANYDSGLAAVIETAMQLVPPPDVTGKRVLLKPNLVDLPRDNRPVTTHPAVIVAVAEAFRRRGASEIIVGDGPALQRDAWQIVDAIGLSPLLSEHALPFIDLNTAEIIRRQNLGTMTDLDSLYYSRTAWEADVLVSLPKLKTHHWATASLSMKNLFGTLSSVVYGWPRNIFHRRNLHHAVIDFNRTRPAEYAIVDGIVGMEGDGPVRGTAIDVGVIVAGQNLAAVDATAARVMGIAPEYIDYLRFAAGSLGPIGETSIKQLGEPIQSVLTPFAQVSALTSLHV